MWKTKFSCKSDHELLISNCSRVLDAAGADRPRTVTDLDILAIRLHHIRGDDPDPALGARPGAPDMIVGEVKEGAGDGANHDARNLAAGEAVEHSAEPLHAVGCDSSSSGFTWRFRPTYLTM